jgi:predicted Zn-dependent protease
MQHFAALPQAQRSALLARVAAEMGGDAAPMLRRVLRLDPSDEVRLEALNRLRRIDPQGVEDELRGLAAEEGLARWAWEQLGHDLLRRGESDGAIAAYESARQAGSGDVRVTTSLARLYMRERQWARGRDLFKELLADDPENLELLRELGQCHYILGDEAAAEAAWRRMVDAEEGTPDAWLALAQAYNAIGARDKEIAILREGCAEHPGHYELLRRLARAYLHEQRYGEAVATLEDALDGLGADYQRRGVVLELARVLRLGGQLRSYLDRNEAGLAGLDREIVALLQRVADRRLAAGDRAGARDTLERLIACYPDSEAARRAAGRIERLGGGNREGETP